MNSLKERCKEGREKKDMNSLGVRMYFLGGSTEEMIG